MKNIITQIREITGQSRVAFSKAYGIPVRTLENWEAGIAEAPNYTIDLLTRAALEDSGRYTTVRFFVTEIKAHDEFDHMDTTKITEAIRCTQNSWDCLSEYDKKHSDFEIRIYEDGDCMNYDTIEWR